MEICWTFAFNEHGASYYSGHIALGVQSFKRMQRDWEIECIYSGNDHPILSWLKKEGVILHRRSSKWLGQFQENIERSNVFNPAVASGAYLRLEVPHVCRSRYVLYTDVDVVFMKKIEAGDLPQPQLFACCEEVAVTKDGPVFHRESFNSGVMVMNVPAFNEVLPCFEDFLLGRKFDFTAYDQGALNEFFARKWSRLSPEYNWRPFMGINESAKILHFHGPKVGQVLQVMGRRNCREVMREDYCLLYELAPEAYIAYVENLRASYDLEGLFLAKR